MGSTLVGPTIEDVDDVDLPSSHVIHIHEPDASSASTTATADAVVPMSAELSLLDEKFSLLLAAHSREAAAVSARMDALEALKLADLMAAAAASAAAAGASAAQSAAEAARLVKSTGEAVETAAEVMEAVKLSLSALSADGAIPDLLTEHCVNAATAAKQHVTTCLLAASEEAEDFIEETRKREQAAAVAAVAEKRGSGKRR